MSKKANPTSIGLFIVIGLALGVAGLLLFSSSRLFTRTREYILYFNDSLNGLTEGAPVKYRGVTVGSVKRVMINFNQATNDTAMPVLIEIQENLVQARLGTNSFEIIRKSLEGDLSSHLRATLEAESLVTGVLYINLARLRDPTPAVYHQVEKIYAEIPTQPTQIQAFLSNLAQLDFKGFGDKLSALITKMDTTLGSLRTGEISQGITNLLVSLNRLATSSEFTNTLLTLQSTLTEYRQVATRINSRVDPLADAATNTLAEASVTLAQLRTAVQDLRGLISPDSPLRSDLSEALEQLATAAQSISGLADFLERHPNALITGREPRPKKP